MHDASQNPAKRRLTRSAPMKFCHEDNNKSINAWITDKWNQEWQNLYSNLRRYLPNVSNKPTGCDLARSTWIKLHRLQSDAGCFRNTLRKWGMPSDPSCACSVPQTLHHIRYSGAPGDFYNFDKLSHAWLTQINLSF